MPVYVYRCDECGRIFEKRLHMRDAGQPVNCPDGHQKVRRVYSTPSVVFKGSGFYVTDHRGTGSRE